MPERAHSVAEVVRVLRNATSIGVVGHVGPDGDALGSMIALSLAARNAGIEAYASFAEPFVVPEEMSFLDTSTLVAPSAFPKDLDVAVVVDTSVPERVGSMVGALESARCLVVIDHHISDGTWGDHLLIDRTAAATTELIYEILIELQWEVTEPVAAALYTGIVTDTGRFQYSSTSPLTHTIAADLLRRGVHPDVVGQKLFEEASFGYYHVVAAVMGRAKFDRDHEFVWSMLTPDDLETAGVKSHETDGLIDLVRMARGSEVACLLKVKKQGVVKGSLRSRGQIDVAAIASSFSGGGHHNAAGFTSTDQPDDIIAAIIDLLP
ncbi:MAG: bifunctional oligoribonuclease/PAP phosphatase NrnA [Actinomycetia bacterium]|nr:bifunctional oligoribonuclease/PAP phosphatase NrnA [Actinomycetes bacterium]